MAAVLTRPVVGYPRDEEYDVILAAVGERSADEEWDGIKGIAYVYDL